MPIRRAGMTDRTVPDRGVKRITFHQEVFEDNIDKTITAIQRWFRNQDDDVLVSDIHCHQGITGSGEGDKFMVTVTYIEPT